MLDKDNTIDLSFTSFIAVNAPAVSTVGSAGAALAATGGGAGPPKRSSKPLSAAAAGDAAPPLEISRSPAHNAAM